jgi:hypothetical protein
MAARGGHVLVLSRLASLQVGLDINRVDTWGFTPLDQAIANEQWPCVTLLLALGGALPASCMHATHAMWYSMDLIIRNSIIRALAGPNLNAEFSSATMYVVSTC